MLIRSAEVPGAGAGACLLDVRIADGRIAEMAASLEAAGGEAVFDAQRGALLPGLHDHHLHLQALAAAGHSIRCGPPEVRTARELARVLRDAEGGSAWLRGVAYHESVAGLLDRDTLDRLVPDRPLRIQHRSGALWMLNSRALEAIDAARDAPPGLERDASGRPSGRVYRADAWLGARLAGNAPDLAADLSGVGRRLASCGITGVSDASAQNDAQALERLCHAVDSGALPQRLLVMGRPELPAPTTARVSIGAVKVLLDEARLPDFGEFCTRLRDAHARERAFAVHCATRAELLFALAAFRAEGSRPGDRIEHASVAPPDAVEALAALGLCVVTQPHFIAERGDRYCTDVAAEDLPWLYRARAWLEAGVALAAGSDAPYGSPDPWAAMRAAVSRRSERGVQLGAAECLDPEQALSLFSAPLEAPGGAPRRVEAGAAADLCLLVRPWNQARERLVREDVAATWCGGALAWKRGDPAQ